MADDRVPGVAALMARYVCPVCGSEKDAELPPHCTDDGISMIRQGDESVAARRAAIRERRS
jgi:hypothetical protein